MQVKLKALRTLLESVQVLGIPADEVVFMITIDGYFAKLGINWEEVATEDEIGIVERYSDKELIAYYIILINRILLAREFSRMVLEHLTTNELDLVLTDGIELNDLYDANADMLEAFKIVLGYEWENVAEINEIFNSAWDLAHKEKFYINK